MRNVIKGLETAEENEKNKFLLQTRPQLEKLLTTPEKMVSEFMMMFLAGTDTTSHLLHNILLLLHEHQDIKAQVE